MMFLMLYHVISCLIPKGEDYNLAEYDVHNESVMLIPKIQIVMSDDHESPKKILHHYPKYQIMPQLKGPDHLPNFQSHNKTTLYNSLDMNCGLLLVQSVSRIAV